LPDGAAEFMVDAGTRLTLVLLPVQRLHNVYSALSLTSPFAQAAGLRPFLLSDGSWSRRLQAAYEEIRSRLVRDEAAADGLLGRLVELHVQAALPVSGMDSPPCPRGRRAHYLVLQRAERYMRLHLRSDIYMEELCKAIGVSDRALRYAFKSMLGVSPNRYLSMMRLCEACKSLASADSEARSVKSVALSCGLWDLSRFADNYRKVFGELPSDTLQRAPSRYASEC
jgi:AraC family ethanolamine operon transcriptional activator